MGYWCPPKRLQGFVRIEAIESQDNCCLTRWMHDGGYNAREEWTTTTVGSACIGGEISMEEVIADLLKREQF